MHVPISAASIRHSLTNAQKTPGEMGYKKCSIRPLWIGWKRKFRDAQDFSNVADRRWKDKYTVISYAFRLVLEIAIRNSGDGLTSVGNLAISGP